MQVLMLIQCILSTKEKASWLVMIAKAYIIFLFVGSYKIVSFPRLMIFYRVVAQPLQLTIVAISPVVFD